MISHAPHIPTDQTRARVHAMAGYGVNANTIAVLLGISADAVRTHYAQELIAGPIEALAQVRQALYAAAMRGDRLAIRLWGQMSGQAP
jgi:hypothetical protein